MRSLGMNTLKRLICKDIVMETQHTPVLLQKVIEELGVIPGGKYIDATYGLGGHSKAIVQAGGIVLGIDWDDESINIQRNADHEGITLALGNYADIKEIAQRNAFMPVDGILFDLGLSMWQIRQSQRGFSYEKDQESEPLDMRINEDISQTAAHIVNSYSIDQLYDIFSKYSEEVNSRAIVHAIDQQRRIKHLRTVGDLKRAIQTVTKSAGTIARIFQALRMEVNEELHNIEKGIMGGYECLKPGGKMIILSFHPTEDRYIKNLIRFNTLTAAKKAIRAKQGKSFERSALLRVITKI